MGSIYAYIKQHKKPAVIVFIIIGVIPLLCVLVGSLSIKQRLAAINVAATFFLFGCAGTMLILYVQAYVLNNSPLIKFFCDFIVAFGTIGLLIGMVGQSKGIGISSDIESKLWVYGVLGFVIGAYYIRQKCFSPITSLPPIKTFKDALKRPGIVIIFLSILFIISFELLNLTIGKSGSL